MRGRLGAWVRRPLPGALCFRTTHSLHITHHAREHRRLYLSRTFRTATGSGCAAARASRQSGQPSGGGNRAPTRQRTNCCPRVGPAARWREPGVGLRQGQEGFCRPHHDYDHLMPVVDDVVALHDARVVEHHEQLGLPARQRGPRWRSALRLPTAAKACAAALQALHCSLLTSSGHQHVQDRQSMG